MSLSAFKQLTFLGTSSGCPTAFRNVSASALQFTDGRMWLFDCGEGTQHQVVKSGSSIAGANPWMALTTPPFQSSSVSLSRIERIFITHLHGDHCYGLPGLMCTLSLTWQAPGVVSDATFFLAKRGVKQQQKAADTTKEEVVEEDDFDDENTEGMVYDHFSKTSQYLELYGPPGLAMYLRGVFKASEAGFGFQYRVHELVHPTTAHVASNPLDTLPCEAPTVLVGCDGAPTPPTQPNAADGPPKKVDPAAPPADALFYNLTTLGAPAADGQVAVHSAYLSHRVTSVGYILVEPHTPGTLDMQACLKAGVPKGPLLAALKRGEDVTIPKSDPPVIVKAADVIGVPTPGRTFIHLGDTSCSDNIVTICQKLGEKQSVDGGRLCPDYLVHESTFDDDTAILAVPRGHSTSRMAGGFAKQLGVKDTLILTHFSARYPPPHSATVNADGLHPMTVLLNQAKDEAAKDHSTSSSSSSTPTPNVIAAHDFMVVDLSRKQKSASDPSAAKKSK